MIDLIAKFMGTNLPPQEIPTQREMREYFSYGELPNQFLDSSKIKKELGWEANVNLNEGLHKTIAWYQVNQHKLKPLYEAEINQFQLTNG